MGQRYWLGSVLLQAGRTADALSFAQVWFDPEYYGNWPPRGGCEFKTPSQVDEHCQQNSRAAPCHAARGSKRI